LATALIWMILFFLGHGGRDGQRDAARDGAQQEVDLLAQDEVLGLPDADVDLELGVANRQRDLPAQDAAGGVDVVGAHLEGVGPGLTDAGGRARQAPDHPDLDRLLLCHRRRRHRCQHQERGRERRSIPSTPHHGSTSCRNKNIQREDPAVRTMTRFLSALHHVLVTEENGPRTGAHCFEVAA